MAGNLQRLVCSSPRRLRFFALESICKTSKADNNTSKIISNYLNGSHLKSSGLSCQLYSSNHVVKAPAIPVELEGMTTTTTDGIKGIPLYLDAQATTPLDPRVLDAMLPYLTSFYRNPHSRTRAYGWESEKTVETAEKVATMKKHIITTQTVNCQTSRFVELFTNPTLYRVPLKAPSIINERLIIDYIIPTRHPKSEILEDPSAPTKTIEEAPKDPINTVIEKQAARLIVIRRSKMNKHKLKKLRKKMKYVWAKVRQRREIRKEKAFLNALMTKIRDAEKFDAKAYVADIILKAKQKPPVVMWWKRSRLPDYLVKEKLAEKAKQEQKEYLSILDKCDPENK